MTKVAEAFVLVTVWNGNEHLLFFEQAVETSRPDSSVPLERGDTWITVHSVAEERDMLAEYGVNSLFQPP